MRSDGRKTTTHPPEEIYNYCKMMRREKGLRAERRCLFIRWCLSNGIMIVE